MGNIRAFGAVELRRTSRPGLLGLVAMLKCGMNGSQVKGGWPFFLSYGEKGKPKVHGGYLHRRLISSSLPLYIRAADPKSGHR